MPSGSVEREPSILDGENGTGAKSGGSRRLTAREPANKATTICLSNKSAETACGVASLVLRENKVGRFSVDALGPLHPPRPPAPPLDRGVVCKRLQRSFLTVAFDACCRGPAKAPFDASQVAPGGSPVASGHSGRADRSVHFTLRAQISNAALSCRETMSGSTPPPAAASAPRFLSPHAAASSGL